MWLLTADIYVSVREMIQVMTLKAIPWLSRAHFGRLYSDQCKLLVTSIKRSTGIGCPLKSKVPKCRLQATSNSDKHILRQFYRYQLYQSTRNASRTVRPAFNVNPKVARDTLVFSYSHDFFYNSISVCTIVMVFGLLFQAYVTIVDFSQIKVDPPAYEGTKNWRRRFKEWVLRQQWTVLATTYILAGIPIQIYAILARDIR